MGKGLRLQLLHFSRLCCYQMCSLSQDLETRVTNPSIVSPQNEDVSCTFNVFPLTHTKGVKVETEPKTKRGRLSEYDAVKQSDIPAGSSVFGPLSSKERHKSGNWQLVATRSHSPASANTFSINTLHHTTAQIPKQDALSIWLHNCTIADHTYCDKASQSCFRSGRQHKQGLWSFVNPV